MRMIETATWKADNKYFSERAQSKVICKCSKRTVFDGKHDRKMCDWCGNWVYKNKAAEFRYKMQEQMRKA